MKERNGKMNKRDFRKITEMLEENYNKKIYFSHIFIA